MTTDAEVIRDLATARAAGMHLPLVDHDDAPVVTTIVPTGWDLETLDTEQYAERPRRPRGTVQVHDAAGFIRSVRRRAAGTPTAGGWDVVLYANEETKQLVAVLNDDAATTGEMVADWRDYRVELALRPRPEWKHWRKLNEQYVDQEAFAEHVELGLAELIAPPAAEALEIAQTFQATVGTRFGSGIRLQTGVRQFTFEETVDAHAGELQIPEELVLAVAPFYGAPKYEVRARFRFRLRAGELRLGYLLNQPDEVERAAFNDVVTAVANDLDLEESLVAGIAPSARS
jgi:uncharacterized protein YfdQ (DUF2303 family)